MSYPTMDASLAAIRSKGNSRLADAIERAHAAYTEMQRVQISRRRGRAEEQGNGDVSEVRADHRANRDACGRIDVRRSPAPRPALRVVKVSCVPGGSEESEAR